MSTPLTDSINALTQYANEVTGKSDTTLSDAVQSLVDGYGSSELYPVSTDIVSMYLGRNWANGNGNFVRGTVNTKTGEFTQTDVSTDNGLCMVYIPIDPSYTYVKNDAGRIYAPCVYDENYNFIKQLTQNLNNLSWSIFQQFPENARYFRFATHANTNNWDICIFRIA